jgi:membrane protein
MLSAFDVPISWSELIKRTIKDANADNVLGLAAQLAYYFLLALVPAIVCVVALTSFVPPQTIERMLQSAGTVVPGDMLDILRDQLDNLRQSESGGLLSLGLLMALWSSSAALVAVTDALNRAYDIEEGRPWWKVRLLAMGLTIGLAVFVVSAFTLVVAGPELAEVIGSRIGLGDAFTVTWKLVQWPIAFALVALGIGLIYYFAPDADQDWIWITPGSVLATLLWLVASLAFRLYVTNVADYNATYGSLGGVIVLMLWFYLSGLAILTGAELNAEIEHASPYGKEPGEKVPGEKKKIGARARRAWEERQRQLPPSADAAARKLVR